MNIRFYHAKLLLPGENHSFTLKEGELWVRKDTIVYIGDGSDVQKIFEKDSSGMILWDREIDARGNLLMPGFKDAHTHSAMTFLRSHADDLPLEEWLNRQVFPYEARLTEEMAYLFDILGIMEYLTSGITSNFDMYPFSMAHARASVDCGFRTVQVSGFNDFVSSIGEMEELYHIINEMSPLTSFFPGFHAEYTTSKAHMEQLAHLSQKLKAPVYMHNSETKKEVRECQKRYHASPTQIMDSLGMFAYGGGGYHCIYLDEQDLEIFQKRKLHIITNPASNLKLASGIAPIKRFVDAGINVAIGTDGAASNNCLDMFREMFLAAGLAKVLNEDAAAISAEEILYMATAGGARAMQLPDCDILAVGKKADLILLDLQQPNMQPEHNLVKNIVYSGSKRNVKLTMVNGKILYEDGRFDIGISPEEIYLEANKAVRHIIQENI